MKLALMQPNVTLVEKAGIDMFGRVTFKDDTLHESNCSFTPFNS